MQYLVFREKCRLIYTTPEAGALLSLTFFCQGIGGVSCWSNTYIKNRGG